MGVEIRRNSCAQLQRPWTHARDKGVRPLHRFPIDVNQHRSVRSNRHLAHAMGVDAALAIDAWEKREGLSACSDESAIADDDDISNPSSRSAPGAMCAPNPHWCEICKATTSEMFVVCLQFRSNIPPAGSEQVAGSRANTYQPAMVNARGDERGDVRSSPMPATLKNI